MGPTGEDGEADERAGSVCAGDAPGGRAAPVPLIPPVPLDLHWAADGPPPVCVIPRLRAPPSAFRWGAGGPGTGRRVAPPARTSSGSNAADRAVNRRANTPSPARRRTRRRAGFPFSGSGRRAGMRGRVAPGGARAPGRSGAGPEDGPDEGTVVPGPHATGAEGSARIHGSAPAG